jgi:hypothetical protein
MEQQQRRNSPEMQTLRRKIEDESYTREGMMIAFPTCFPGVTIPITHDESRITALDMIPSGTIYGGTSGYQTHLFSASFYGIKGAVIDLGIVKEANQCVAVCCGKSNFAAFVNGPKGGGHAIIVRNSRIATDLIQEWSFDKPSFEDMGECVSGEPVIHAVADREKDLVIGATTKHVFKLDLTTKKIEILGEAPSGGRLAKTSKGNFVGRDSTRSLWVYNPAENNFRRNAVNLPSSGGWNLSLMWARDNNSGLLYTADEEGKIYSYQEDRGFDGPLDKTMLTPVGPMGVTNDGRVFGFCGPELAKFFCYNPQNKKVTPMGFAASIIEHRRYGYEFRDAITGRDGEIIFGENDNGGHLWLYYPKIMTQQT